MTTAAARVARQALGLPDSTPEQERAATDRALAAMWEALTEVASHVTGADGKTSPEWERMCAERTAAAAYSAHAAVRAACGDVAAVRAAYAALAATEAAEHALGADDAVRAVVYASHLLPEQDRRAFLKRHLTPLTKE